MRLATLTLALMLSVTAQAGPDGGPTDLAGHGESRTADLGPDDADGSTDRLSPADDVPATAALVPMALQQGNGTDDNGTTDDPADDDALDDGMDERNAVTSRTTGIGLGALALVVLVFFFVRSARK